MSRPERSGSRGSRQAGLNIGALVFDGMDQIDLTGPFEVFGHLPQTHVSLYGISSRPVRDIHGLRLQPDGELDDAPPLDVLHVPGGWGQERLMENERLLTWLAAAAGDASFVFSVCTGALLLGAAGLLRGRRATTHWASMELLPYFGAVPVQERVVVDGRFTFAAGVTAGIDGALHLAARLCGEERAQTVQLMMEYAPAPPFDSGTPASAPASVLALAFAEVAEIRSSRLTTARRAAQRLGVQVPE